MRTVINIATGTLFTIALLACAGCDLDITLPFVFSKEPFGTVPSEAETKAFVGVWEEVVAEAEPEPTSPQSWRIQYVKPGEVRVTIEETKGTSQETGVLMVRRLGDVWLAFQFLEADPKHEAVAPAATYGLMGWEIDGADTMRSWLYESRDFRPAIDAGTVTGELYPPDNDDENPAIRLTDTPENLMRVFNEEFFRKLSKPKDEDVAVLKRRRVSPP